MPSSSDADIQAIEATVQDFLTAIKNDDLDGMLAFYLPVAVIMPPDRTAMKGSDAIRAFFRNVLADFAVEDFASFPEEVVIVSDWGFRRGAFTWLLKPRGGGKTVERRSKFLQIWRRQHDGTWRVARGIWNADGPAADSD